MKLKTNDIVVRLREKVPSLEGINALNIALFIIDSPSIEPLIEANLDHRPYDVVHDLLGLSRKDEFFVPRVLIKKQTDMEKFARVCDITNEGMNEGYCIGDGDMYIKHEKDFVQHLKDIKFSDEELTDDELVELAYEEEYYYWTEWEELDDDYYYLEDGTLVETVN